MKFENGDNKFKDVIFKLATEYGIGVSFIRVNGSVMAYRFTNADGLSVVIPKDEVYNTDKGQIVCYGTYEWISELLSCMQRKFEDTILTLNTNNVEISSLLLKLENEYINSLSKNEVF